MTHQSTAFSKNLPGNQSVCAVRAYCKRPSSCVQLLEGLSDTLGLEVCERALDRRPGLAAGHFLSDYLTLHFQSQVSPARQRHIHALHLGSKVSPTLTRHYCSAYFQNIASFSVRNPDSKVKTNSSLYISRPPPSPLPPDRKSVV